MAPGSCQTALTQKVSTSGI